MMYGAYYHRGYVVRIAIPYNGIFDNIGPLLEPLFISAALSLCVALALSYRFSRTLTKPLEEISEEVSNIYDNRYFSFDHYQRRISLKDTTVLVYKNEYAAAI